MKNITSLRNHLFDQLNRLAEASPEDLDAEVAKAASIVQVAETIIKTAQVENQFIAITKGTGSGFIPIIDGISPKQIGNITVVENEDEEKKPEIFNPDTEKNWLMDDGKVLANDNSGIEVHELGTNQNG